MDLQSARLRKAVRIICEIIALYEYCVFYLLRHKIAHTPPTHRSLSNPPPYGPQHCRGFDAPLLPRFDDSNEQQQRRHAGGNRQQQQSSYAQRSHYADNRRTTPILRDEQRDSFYNTAGR